MGLVFWKRKKDEVKYKFKAIDQQKKLFAVKFFFTVPRNKLMGKYEWLMNQINIRELKNKKFEDIEKDNFKVPEKYKDMIFGGIFKKFRKHLTTIEKSVQKDEPKFTMIYNYVDDVVFNKKDEHNYDVELRFVGHYAD